jgi:hypothetical protein
MQGMCLQQKFVSQLKVYGNDVLNQQSAEKCVCRYNQMNWYGGCGSTGRPSTASTPNRKVWKTQLSNTEELESVNCNTTLVCQVEWLSGSFRGRDSRQHVHDGFPITKDVMGL